jgi:hypothetical protein
MKSIKLLALSSLLTVGIFSVVLYTSCSKDACKGVTCQNGGTCSGGNCVCPTGTTGNNCETIYRLSFDHTYVGTGSDNTGGTYTNFRMVFSTPSSSTDFVTMNLTIQDATGGSAGVPVLTITLSSFSTSGANYTITSTTNAGLTYTGTGTISATSASMTLQEAGSGTTTTYTFSNFAKQSLFVNIK